ncbi:MAG: hypothetical protein D6762_01150 [Candidatus Neomarinimicrobiota bacterium]|nr:MAG: hypothetical protein D6762_01150 [Candidatus Neomarinimicrobiota bacterium]
MKELENIVTELAAPDLVVLECSWNEISGRLVVIVDKPEGVSLEDTSQLAKRIMNDERIQSLASGGIRAEVSSPGIDYPLRLPFQFERNEGRRVRLKSETPEFSGEYVLEKYEQDRLIVSRQGKQFSVPLTDVNEVRAVVSF